MSHAWFICNDSKVTGPFTTEEISANVSTGRLGAGSFIWWKGQREWLPISFWQEHLQEITESVKVQTNKAIWHLEIEATRRGPFTQAELLKNLKQVKDLAAAIVWAEGSEKKLSVLEIPDLMQLIGINRRDFERTPLMAKIFTTFTESRDHREFMLDAASISEGGIGIASATDLRRGDLIAMSIMSPEFREKLHVQGEVMYVTKAGYAGIKFRKISPEAQSIIADYVQRFETSQKAQAA